MASADRSQVIQRIKLGTEDIVTLRARLTSHTTLLNGFIQRLDIATIAITITMTIEYIILISQRSCDSHRLDESSHKLDEIQAQLNIALGLRRSPSLVSLAGSINTKKVYGNFCKGLFESGITADMIKGKEKEIHSMFKPPDATTSSQVEASSQINVSTNADQSQLPEGSNSSDSETSPLPTISTESNQNQLRFPWVLPPMDFFVGPLMLDAAKAGNIKRLKSTLGYVRDINFMDDTGATALHKAALGGYNDIVQLLLTKGASIEAVNKCNDTPLHNAALYHHYSTVELLLSKGALIEATNNDNNTPLHLAVQDGPTSTVGLLLSKGASIEATNKDNNTPLHLAARHGSTTIVKLLLSKGASIKATDKDNNTPLDCARQISHGNTGVVRLLKWAEAINSLETYETVSG